MKQTILDLFINKFFNNLIKESEIITANNLNFYIEILYRNNEIDFNFIKKYKKDIKAFFDKEAADYYAKGLNNRNECEDTWYEVESLELLEVIKDV